MVHISFINKSRNVYGWCVLTIVLTIVYVQINLTECKRKTHGQKLYSCFYISFAAFAIQNTKSVCWEIFPLIPLISLIFRSYLFNGTPDIITLPLSLFPPPSPSHSFKMRSLIRYVHAMQWWICHCHLERKRCFTESSRAGISALGIFVHSCRWNWDLSDLRIFCHCVTVLRIFQYNKSNLDHALFYISHRKKLICSEIFAIAHCIKIL